MERLLRIVLLPFSYLYGFIIWIRNLLYDLKGFKSYEFKVPVISVGNITVGGTGKTPHTEYLIRLLKDSYKVAFLSRGYKRKTSDFRFAGIGSTVEEVGDEPLQISNKFPDILVAVDKSRVNGINKIQESYRETDIVLLDDAFQHRSVKPGINILLVDYNRPIFNDSLLPSGRLREPISGKDRADIIVVSKTPGNISAIDRRLFMMNINVQPYQSIYFTTIKYVMPEPVFSEIKTDVDFNKTELSVLLVTGIANANNLVSYLQKKYSSVEHIAFADHHYFMANDIHLINEKYKALLGENKVIFTTEKDAVRFRNMQNNVVSPDKWFYLPIEVEFLHDEGDQFNRQIIHYVSKNSRNSLLYKEQN